MLTEEFVPAALAEPWAADTAPRLDPANAPAAPPAAKIPIHTHFLCDLPPLLATGPPLLFADLCVMMMVCILEDVEATTLGADSVMVCRLAGADRRLASMALGVAARVGLDAAGVVFAGGAFGGVSLTVWTVSAGARAAAGALAIEDCVFRSALPVAAPASSMRCRTTTPARACSLATVTRTLNGPGVRLS